MDQVRMDKATTRGPAARKTRAALAPLTPPQRALAEQFLPLARALAKPLKQMFRHWRDDFESAACMALVEAARTFDPDRNIRFATFARFRIRGALNDVGRSMALSGWEKDHDNAPEVHRLTPLNEEFGIVLNTREDPAVGSEMDALDAIEQWFRKLPRRHAEICRLCYVDGKTQTEVAEELGISQSEVTRLHRQSLVFLAEPYRPGDPSRPGRRRTRRKAESLAPQAELAV